MLRVANLSVTRSAAFRLTVPELHVPPGSIMCITGPNGSGKTTLVGCLAGLLKPTNGTVHIDGHRIDNELWASKSLVGLAPDDEDWFIKELTAREYLGLLQRVYREAGVRINMAELAETMAGVLHFTAFDQQLESLSHGNKKKVQLIAALMHKPRLIIVDELRNGLDPLAIMAAESLIVAQAKAGACVIATTHDLWWAERIASEVLLLVDGTTAAHQLTQEIIRQHGSVENLFMRTVQGTK